MDFRFMKKMSLINRSEFFFGIGYAVIFVQVPFIFLIMNSNGATVMPAWNWSTISIIFLINFILTPLLLHLLLSLTNLCSAAFKRLLISLAVAYPIVIQICFYLFPSLDNFGEAIITLITVPILTIILYLLHRYLFLILGAAGLALPISLVCFLLASAPMKSQSSQTSNNFHSNAQNDTIIITAEKLTAPFMLERDGSVRAEFPNLKRLANTSNLYTDLHSRTIHTAGGLDAVLLGAIGTNSTPKGMQTFRGRDILSKGSLVDFYSDGRKVYVYNDYTGERYCDRKKHYCVKIFQQASVGSSIKLISAFYWEYLDSMLPKGVLRRIKQKQLAFFEDILLVDDDPMKYPEMQFKKFLEGLENANEPVLMIMHTFMTDGGFANTFGYSELDLSEAETQKWKRTKVFDNYVGRLMNKLEQKGRFKDSLFLIISDTGSDVASMVSLTEPRTIVQKYNENMSKIFAILHHPTQKKGMVVRDRLFQEDIFQIMTEKGSDTKMHNVKNAQQIYLQAKSSLGVRTFNLNEETGFLQLEE
jgi:hypothetical protein